MSELAAPLLLLLLLSPPAAAVGKVDTPGQRPETIESLARDVAQGEPPERRYAVRTLRSWVRTAVRQSLREGDPLIQDEALATLQRFDDSVAPACIEALDQREATVACADILGALLTTEALPALEAALAAEQRRRAGQHLEQAIEQIRTHGESP